MTIKEKIIRLFEYNNELSVKEITDNSLVSKQMVPLVLSKLKEENKVVKYGRVPKTVYRYADVPMVETKMDLKKRDWGLSFTMPNKVKTKC